MMTLFAAKIAWFLGIVGWFVIRYPFQRRARRLGVVRSAVGTRERVLLTISATGQFIIPLIYVVTGQPAVADTAFYPWIAALGVIVLIAALILFRVTHKQLGRNWSISLETRSDHRLVTAGPYRYVRHPMYSSFLLSAIGQLLLLPNWVAGPSGLVGLAILFFFRVGKEEALMVETFGEQYRIYMRKTARIVPFIY
jgi:protein-S-isoprenylcysteine O-methyltransferase Ste14